MIAFSFFCVVLHSLTSSSSFVQAIFFITLKAAHIKSDIVYINSLRCGLRILFKIHPVTHTSWSQPWWCLTWQHFSLSQVGSYGVPIMGSLICHIWCSDFFWKHILITLVGFLFYVQENSEFQHVWATFSAEVAAWKRIYLKEAESVNG